MLSFDVHLRVSASPRDGTLVSRTARVIALILASVAPVAAQNPTSPRRPDSVVTAARAPRVPYTSKTSRADTLRGSYTTPGRRWWDVTFYDLHVRIDPKDSSIAGWNGISYRVTEAVPAARELQIDLMEPLVVDSMRQDGRNVRFRREGNAFSRLLIHRNGSATGRPSRSTITGGRRSRRIRRGKAGSRGPRTASAARGW